MTGSSGDDKTSILVSAKNEPGSLYKLLSPLSKNSTYYIKIFPYTNSGSNINYKIKSIEKIIDKKQYIFDRYKNELKKLSLIAKPDLIIISNVSNNHLENFKSEKDIALAKSEIFHGLTKNGQVILNYDNKSYNFLKKIGVKIKIRLIH